MLSFETVIDAIVFVPFFVSYFDLPYLLYIYVPYFFRVAGINGKLHMMLAMVARLQNRAFPSRAAPRGVTHL